jgi:hypothetical protein
MSGRLPLLAATLACLLPAPSRADCDLARFGASAAGACARSAADCVPAYLPEEIRAIAGGAVLETVGLGVNDGRASWRALDIERREVVVVERYAGRKVGQAPKVDPATASEYLKTVDPEPKRSVDHVRRYPVSPAQAAALACPVSGAGAAPAPPVRTVSDTGSRFYLLLGETAHSSTAIGRFEGAPGGFGRAIDEIVKRGRPGAPAR